MCLCLYILVLVILVFLYPLILLYSYRHTKMNFSCIVKMNYNIFLLDILLMESLVFYNHIIVFHLIILHLKIIMALFMLMCILISSVQILHQMTNFQYPIIELFHLIQLLIRLVRTCISNVIFQNVL